MNRPTFPLWAIVMIILLVLTFMIIVGGVVYYAYNPSLAAIPGDILSVFVKKKADVINHSIYLYTINDPDQDKDGLSDKAETQIYMTDPSKADSNGSGVDDGQYIYNIYKKAFDTGDEGPLLPYRANLARYKKSIASSSTALQFVGIVSNKEMFIIKSLETYNLYVGLPADLKQIVIQAMDVRQRGDYQKSLDLLQSAISVNPSSSILKYHLGLSYHGMKQYDKAIAIYESIVNDPTLKSPLLYSDIASAYLSLFNGDKFVENMRRSIKEFPDDLIQYSKLATYYQSKNLLDYAEKVLKEGLKIEPRYADYYNSLAIISNRRGDLKGELGYYQTAVSYDFRYAVGHRNLSILYQEMYNDLKGALTEALIALEIDPTPSHVSGVMEIYGELGQSAQSQEYENELLKMENIDAPSYNSLGLKYMDANNFTKAEIYLRKAIAADPTLPNPYNNLGIVLVSTGREDEGAASYRKAIELNPNYANAYSNLGIYYTGIKDYSKAITNIETAIKLNSNLWRPYQSIAYVYRQLGDSVKEKYYYEKAIDHGCKDPAVIERLKVLNMQ